jgi:pentatricopeptide repeat protein
MFRQKLVTNNIHLFTTLRWYTKAAFNGNGYQVLRLGKDNKMDEAEKCYNELPDSAGAAFLISKQNDFSGALKIHKTLETNSEPNIAVIRSMLKLCTVRRQHKHAETLWSYLEKYKLEPDEITLDTFVTSATISKNAVLLTKILHLWKTLPKIKPNITGTKLINGFTELNRLDFAFDAFNTLTAPDSITYTSIISACRKLKKPERAIDVWQVILKQKFKMDKFVFGSLTSACAEVANSDFAKDLFAYIQTNIHFEPPSVCYAQIIKTFLANKMIDNAFDVLQTMKDRRVEISDNTIVMLITGCADTMSRQKGATMEMTLTDKQLKDQYIATSLIYMHGKFGYPEKSLQAFERVSNPDIVTWTAAIQAVGMNGLGKEAIKLFSMMQSNGITPNDKTYAVIMNACSHNGLVQEAMEIYSQAKKSSIGGDVHLTCLIDALGRAGELEKAEKMTIESGSKDVVLWRSLLSACFNQRDITRGIRLGWYILENISHKDSATCVQLSNMYALAGDRSGVDRVRKYMSAKNIEKIPGISFIEVNGVTHRFVANDDNHPMKEKIHSKLDEIFDQLRNEGFVHDTSGVTRNLSTQQEKIEHLCRHSEKLALALGLLKTPEGADIMINKNVRMCQDCHTATKFISKIVNRTIIVGDANRTHHFKEGRCSCNDYY